MWNRKVFIRVIEVLLCVACVVALRVTDDESRRVFHYLRNRSREWSLLNNVTWGSIGAALATATCGGYIIITTGLLIAAATGELRGRKTEFFLLGLGVILFGIVGALSLASIDSVPEDLVDNAAVLGALCLLTALVFIGDLLMRSPSKKENQDETRIIEKGKRVVPVVTTEKDTKSKSKQTVVKIPDDEDGRLNVAFEKADDRRIDSAKLQQGPSRSRSPDSLDDRDNRGSRDDQDPRERAQNFENGRALRDSQKYREVETMRASAYDPDGKIEESRITYKRQDIYQRPIDEIDTPRFPTEFEKREPTFAKIVNPSVKIMRVERDIEEELNNHRYSDNSQYDNVPVRMRGSPSGILKGHRDASFNVPPPPKDYRPRGRERSKDEIEMLEEYFGVLKTTGTQTARTPSSANEPGYVRHTASNWPQDTKSRASPDHSRV